MRPESAKCNRILDLTVVIKATTVSLKAASAHRLHSEVFNAAAPTRGLILNGYDDKWSDVDASNHSGQCQE